MRIAGGIHGHAVGRAMTCNADALPFVPTNDPFTSAWRLPGEMLAGQGLEPRSTERALWKEQEHVMFSADHRAEEETYTAAGLHVSDIPGTVSVRVWDNDYMRVRITGPRKLVKQIRPEVREDVLYTNGPQGGGGGRSIGSRQGGGNVQNNHFYGGQGGIAVQGAASTSPARVAEASRPSPSATSSLVITGSSLPVMTPPTSSPMEWRSWSTCLGPRRSRSAPSAPVITRSATPTVRAMDDDGGGAATIGRVTVTRVVNGESAAADIVKANGRDPEVKIDGSGDISVHCSPRRDPGMFRV